MALIHGSDGLSLKGSLAPETLFSSKLTLSYWVRWSARVNQSYDMLFGIVGADNAVSQFGVFAYSTDSLALRIGGTFVGFVRPNHGIGPGAWFHIVHQIDFSTRKAVTFINGDQLFESTLTESHVIKPVTPANFQIRMPTFGSNKGSWRLAGLNLFSYHPDVQKIFDGEVSGDLFNYPLLSNGPDSVAVPPAIVPELVNGRFLDVVSGAGQLTPEVGEPSANLFLDSQYITHSGIIWRTSWKKGYGVERITAKLNKVVYFRRNLGPWVATDKYIQAREHLCFVIPEECRPTSKDDLIEYMVPRGTIGVSIADFNHLVSGVCDNQFGVEPYTLPEKRMPLVTNAALVRGNTGGLTNCLESAYLYGNRVAQINEKGVPTHSKTGEPCIVFVENTGPKWKGVITLAWQGSEKAEMVAYEGYNKPFPSEPTYTIQRLGQTWYAKDYDCSFFPQIGFRADNSEKQTYATDMAAILHDEDNFDRWIAGKRFTSRFLRRLGPYQAVRMMDEMEANASCVYDERDCIPDDWQAGFTWQPDKLNNASVVGPYTYPDPNTAFFASSLNFKLKLDKNKDLCRLSTGMAIQPKGVKVDGRYQQYGWQIDCEAPGLAEDEVILSRKGGKTVTFDPVVVLERINVELVGPKRIGEFATEFLEFHGRPIGLWLTRPVTMTDRGWVLFCSQLDAYCPKNTDWLVEFSNETWNTASVFSNQYRYLEGWGRRLGVDGHKVHVNESLQLWDDARDVAPDRRIRLVIAGAMVNPGYLKERMKYVKEELGPRYVNADIVMSVSNYWDDPGFDRERNIVGPDGIPVNVHGCVAAGPLGYIDVVDLGFRDAVKAYPAIKEEFGKPLIAYEGGSSWTIPTIYGTTLIRTVFATAHTPRARTTQIGVLTKYQEEGQFDVGCVLFLSGEYKELAGKNWVQYGWWYQDSGVGDGSDGKFNNVAGLQTYIDSGPDNSDWYNFVSARAQATEDWFTEPEKTLKVRLTELIDKYDMTDEDALVVLDAVNRLP